VLEALVCLLGARLPPSLNRTRDWAWLSRSVVMPVWVPVPVEDDAWDRLLGMPEERE
jgi:hypothetical protein